MFSFSRCLHLAPLCLAASRHPAETADSGDLVHCRLSLAIFLSMLHPHCLLSMLDQRLRATPTGEVRSEGELFMNRELGEIQHKYLFFSDVQIHSCSLPWPTCCLCGILPGQQEGSCSSRNTLLPALSVTSKGKGSRTSCS